MNEPDWLTDDVVAAVARHMNDDHAQDSVRIVQYYTGLDDVAGATTTGIDRTGITFSWRPASGPTRELRVPFSRELTGRADIRAEVVRMYQAAGGTPEEQAH